MFDLLCWIAGQAPVEVYATGSSMMDPAITAAGDVDTSMLILKFADGALCHIDNSRHTGYGYDERIEVFGSDRLALKIGPTTTAPSSAVSSPLGTASP